MLKLEALAQTVFQLLTHFYLQLVAYLDPNGKGYITKEYVQNLTIDQVKQILLFVDPNDVSNTEELEYSHIDGGEIE